MGLTKDHLNKKEALQKVLDSLPEGCYVFGGAIRDSLIGEEFKDIDLFFKNLNAYNSFLRSMADRGYTTRFTREGNYVKRNVHEVRELSVRTDGYEKVVCNIDCVVGSGTEVCHMRPEEWDADIHGVSMDKNGQIKSLTGASDQALAEIIKKIRNKKFSSLPGMTNHRKAKLIMKGFKEMSAPTLSNEPSFFESFKNDVAPEVAYRVTANQLVKATKQGALLAVAAKGGNSETAKTVSEILNTEAGDIAVSAMLMALCMYTPQLNQNPKVKRLAREFQISGMATGANAILDMAREFLLPGLLDALKKLPEIQEESSAQTRVAATAPTALFPESDSQEDEIESAPQKRAAVR